MVIGTDDVLGAQDAGVEYRSLPDQDTIDCHIAILRVMLLNDGRPIEAHDLDVIAAIRDRCDRLSYWAIEEPASAGARAASSSRLAAAVPLCAKMLLSARPKVIAAGAVALSELVATQSNAAMFLGLHKVSDDAHEALSGLQVLAQAMSRCPQHDDTLALCCTIARRLAPHSIEEFLGADIIACVLKAMERHKQSSCLQKEAAAFFSSVVQIPRPDPRDIPVSILMTHVGVCLPYVLHAYKFQPTCSGVAESVVIFLKTLTERRENIEEVASSNALNVLCHAATGNVLVPHMVENAFAAISSLAPELDALQKRSVALTCFAVLTRSVDAAALASSLALLLRIVESFPPAVEASMGDDGPLDEASQFKVFATQQQIPRVVMLALQHFGDDDPAIAHLGGKLLTALCLNRFRY